MSKHKFCSCKYSKETSKGRRHGVTANAACNFNCKWKLQRARFTELYTVQNRMSYCVKTFSCLPKSNSCWRAMRIRISHTCMRAHWSTFVFKVIRLLGLVNCSSRIPPFLGSPFGYLRAKPGSPLSSEIPLWLPSGETRR